MKFLLPGNLLGAEVAVVEACAWDTQILGLRTARITDINSESVGASLYPPLGEGLRQAGFQYVTARRPQSEWAQIHRLENEGFRILDGILNFALNLEKGYPDVTGPLPLRLALARDAERVAELAARTFVLSRFHNDPLLTREQANRVFFEWARNSCLGVVAQAVWLSEVGGQPVGFITCKLKGKDGVIELVAVDSGSAGRGVGAALVQRACVWFAEQGCARVTVQTQSHNLAAIHLYGKLKFTPIAASFTLRWAPGALG